MRVAQVVLDIPTQALDVAYSYALGECADTVSVGCCVLVPFGRRKAAGFVVALRDSSEQGVDESKLKPIEQVLSDPYFDEDGAACAMFLAQRYVAPLSTCVRLFTPPGGVPSVVKAGSGWQVRQPTVGQVDDRWVRLGPNADCFEPSKGAVKQEAILSALRSGELRVSELVAEYGNVSPSLKALEKRGVVVVERRRRMRGMHERAQTRVMEACRADAAQANTAMTVVDTAQVESHHVEGHLVQPRAGYASIPFESVEKPQLTQGQRDALAEISRAQSLRDGHVVVVDGVTGSGKTEVYLRAIESVLNEGRTAIVLVPEISLTPQTVARFRGRFGDLVAVLHSRMGTGERYDQWDFIRSGDARVVVGARSALFAPLKNVGLIVIDEEHESSYKQDQAPRYVSRDVAEWKAKRSGATLVLGSATPSIEALYRAAKCDSWSIVHLPERANGRPMPQVQVVDMAREFGGGSRSMFSLALRGALAETLRAKQKAVLMLNHRGFASFLLCRDCGFVPECPSCSTSLTYHERGSKLVCHHCDHQERVPGTCPQCGSPYLRKFGAGTQRVEAELVAFLETLPDVEAKVIRMDSDTTQRKGAHQHLLEEFAASEAAVLLGTQMIAKGLDFDDVTLVGVINADTQLRLPDFRSAERTFALIEQVAGRAGRAELPGRVIVQTYSADAVPIQAAAHYDRATFLRDELPKRRQLCYPPYARLADVRIWGKNEEEVREEGMRLSEAIYERLETLGEAGWTMLPATPCVLSRLRGAYRYHITVKAPPDADIAAVIAPVFHARTAHKTVNAAVDIDPVSML